MEKTCNVEKYNEGFGVCGAPAEWKHPRYPDGIFCDKCKENVAAFFPDNWSLTEE